MGGIIHFQELAPNYAATVISIVNSVTVWNGFITPLDGGTFYPGQCKLVNLRYFLVKSIFHLQSTINEWNSIFQISAGVYFLSALIFIIFGSVHQIQSRNGSVPQVKEINGDREQQNDENVEFVEDISIKKVILSVDHYKDVF